MAKVATAYVEIKPDLDNFAKDLNTALRAEMAKVHAPKIKIDVDKEGLTKAIGSAVDNPATKRKASKAGREAGDGFSDGLREAIKASAGTVELFDDEKMSDESRHTGKLMQAGILESNKDTGKLYVEQFSQQVDTYIKQSVRKPLDKFRDEAALSARHAAQDAATEFGRQFTDETGKLIKVDKQVFRDFERDMVIQFGNSGGSAARSWLSGHENAFKAQEKKLAKLAAQMGVTVGQEFISSLGAVSNGWSRLIANPIGAALVSAAVVVGGSFASALIAAILEGIAGLGVLVVVALIAMKTDPRIKEAGSELGRVFMKEFGDAILDNSDDLLSAINVLQNAVPGLAKEFDDVADQVSGRFDDLARSLVKGFTSIFDGLEKGAPGLDAALAGIGRLIEDVSAAFGRMFAELGQDPGEVEDAFNDLSATISGLVDMVTGLISAGQQTWQTLKLLSQFSGLNMLNDIFNLEDNQVALWREMSLGILPRTVELLEKLGVINQTKSVIKIIEPEQVRLTREAEEAAAAAAKEVDRVRKAAEDNATAWETFRDTTGDVFGRLSEDARDAQDAVDKLVKSMKVLNGAFIDSEEAQAKFNTEQLAINKAIEDNAKGMDIATEAGIKNRKNLRDQAKATVEMAEARLREGESLSSILVDYNKMRDAIIANADKLGLSKQAAIDYVNALGLTPERLVTEAEVIGVPEAAGELSKLAGDRIVKVKTSMEKDSLASILKFLAFTMTDAGKKSGLDYDQWFAQSIKDNAPAIKTPAQRLADKIAEGVEAGKPVVTQAAKNVTTAVNTAVASNYSQARTLGQGMGGAVASGIAAKQNLTTASNAGKSITNSAAAGINANNNMFDKGVSFAESYARGMQSSRSRSLVYAAAGQVAAWGAGFLQSSPAKMGPLSGKGDTYYRGQTFAKRFAAGMLSEEDTVTSATSSLVNAAQLGIGFAQNDALSTAQTAPIVNVYIGPEKLNDMIDVQVRLNDDETARALIAGRNGV